MPNSLDGAPQTDSARSVLRRLVRSGPGTRPAIAADLNFSKPTLTAAIEELIALGLAESFGQEESAGAGRPAIVYGLGARSGFVMGVDLGNTQVSLLAESLDGNIIAEINEDIPGREAFDMGAVTKSAWAVAKKSYRHLSKQHGRMRAIAIGVPVIVSDNHPQLSGNAWLADLRKAFSFGGVSPLLENNVNCATIAEMRHGAAQGRRSFAYLQVGVKIGLGVVHNGALYRGANGAAGEVARIPYPWMPTGQPVRGALEERLGSGALMERVTKAWPKSGGPRPDSVRALFAAAESGSVTARGIVAAYGLEIGRLAASVIGVMDPGLIVMGGGVGQNPSLVPQIKEVCDDLVWPTEFVSSTLGARGTVLGAVSLAAQAAMDALLESRAS